MADDELTDEHLKELGQALTTLRAEVEANLTTSTEDAQPVDLELSIGRLSRVDALQQQHLAAARKQRLKVQLEQIKSAQARISAGTYGECISCGDAIPLGRLRARPESPLCLKCQR